MRLYHKFGKIVKKESANRIRNGFHQSLVEHAWHDQGCGGAGDERCDGAGGFQLAASGIVGLLGGNFLDGKFGTSPWLTLVGLVLGFGGGLWNLIRILNWHRNRDQG